MKKYLLKFGILLFLYCVGQSKAEVTAVDCIIYFLLIGYIIKDDVKNLLREAIGEEV